MGSCAVEIAYLDGDGLCAALKVRTYGRSEYAELIVVSGLYTDYGVYAEHIRSDIKCSAGSVGRYIGFICLNDLIYRFYESVFREYGHFQPLCRILKSGCIKIGAEHNGSAVLCGVCLQTFKYGLRILQNAGAFVHGDVFVIRKGAFVPCAVCVIGYITFIRFLIGKSQIRPIDVFLFDSHFFASDSLGFLLNALNTNHISPQCQVRDCDKRPGKTMRLSKVILCNEKSVNSVKIYSIFGEKYV